MSTLLGRSSALHHVDRAAHGRLVEVLAALQEHDQLLEQPGDRRRPAVPSTEISLPRTATDASGKAASIWRRLSSRWPSSAAMRCAPGTTTVCILASEVIGARPAGLSFRTTVATPRAVASTVSGPSALLPDQTSSGRPCDDAAHGLRDPQDIADLLVQLDDFIEQVVKPIEQQDDNIRFFDHRREDARTDWERGGLPNEEWEQLLHRVKRLADEAGFYRWPFPKEYGGSDGNNLGMAIIREHLATKGLGLHNDLQNEHSIVGNQVGLILMIEYGTEEQKKEWIDDLVDGRKGFALRDHRATPRLRRHLDGDPCRARRRRVGDQRREDVEHRHPQGAVRHDHGAHVGQAGRRRRDHRVPHPTDSEGFKIEEYLWTFNMPTDHAHVSFTNIRVPNSRSSAVRARACRWSSTSSTRTASARRRRRSAAAQFCVNESVKYAMERKPFGKALSTNQGIQFPLVELQTQCDMLRALIHKTAWQMDNGGAFSASRQVSQCNYWANRLCCEAADRAMQVHGGLGYSRHKPFEHIYRHHRRYRITEGAEEIQMRRVAGYMFGYMKQDAAEGRGRRPRLRSSGRDRWRPFRCERRRSRLARSAASSSDLDAAGRAQAQGVRAWAMKPQKSTLVTCQVSPTLVIVPVRSWYTRGAAEHHVVGHRGGVAVDGDRGGLERDAAHRAAGAAVGLDRRPERVGLREVRGLLVERRGRVEDDRVSVGGRLLVGVHRRGGRCRCRRCCRGRRGCRGGRRLGRGGGDGGGRRRRRACRSGRALRWSARPWSARRWSPPRVVVGAAVVVDARPSSLPQAAARGRAASRTRARVVRFIGR